MKKTASNIKVKKSQSELKIKVQPKLKINQSAQQNLKSKNLFTLITGASSGIGFETALLLATEKHNLILLERRKNNLLNLKKLCLQNGSPVVLIWECDLSNTEKLEKTIHSKLKEAKAKYGSSFEINRLINNAGLALGADKVTQSEWSDWQTMMNVNVMGLMKITQMILPFIIQAKGHIVNLGSVAGRLVYEGGAVYCASKFAVRAFSDGLRMDLKGTGVRVSLISPGMVNTEFSQVRFKNNMEKAEAVYANMWPLSATDIANQIQFVLNQPLHVNVQEIIVYPTDQASVGQVVRGTGSVLSLGK